MRNFTTDRNVLDWDSGCISVCIGKAYQTAYLKHLGEHVCGGEAVTDGPETGMIQVHSILDSSQQTVLDAGLSQLEYPIAYLCSSDCLPNL